MEEEQARPPPRREDYDESSAYRAAYKLWHQREARRRKYLSAAAEPAGKAPRPSGRAPRVDGAACSWDAEHGCWRTPSGAVHDVAAKRDAESRAFFAAKQAADAAAREQQRTICRRIDAEAQSLLRQSARWLRQSALAVGWREEQLHTEEEVLTGSLWHDECGLGIMIVVRHGGNFPEPWHDRDQLPKPVEPDRMVVMQDMREDLLHEGGKRSSAVSEPGRAYARKLQALCPGALVVRSRYSGPGRGMRLVIERSMAYWRQAFALVEADGSMSSEEYVCAFRGMYHDAAERLEDERSAEYSRELNLVLAASEAAEAKVRQRHEAEREERRREIEAQEDARQQRQARARGWEPGRCGVLGHVQAHTHCHVQASGWRPPHQQPSVTEVRVHVCLEAVRLRPSEQREDASHGQPVCDGHGCGATWWFECGCGAQTCGRSGLERPARHKRWWRGMPSCRVHRYGEEL